MPEEFFGDLPKTVHQIQLLNSDVREGTYQGTEFWLHTMQRAKKEGEVRQAEMETPYGKFKGNIWSTKERQAWELTQETPDGREISVIGASVQSSKGEVDLFEIKKDPDGTGYWRRHSHSTSLKDWGGTQYDYVLYEEPIDFVVMFLEKEEFRSCQRPTKAKGRRVLRYEFDDSREPYQTLRQDQLLNKEQ